MKLLRVLQENECELVGSSQTVNTDDEVRGALKLHGGNVPAAAGELGMRRTTLWRRARKLAGRGR